MTDHHEDDPMLDDTRFDDFDDPAFEALLSAWSDAPDAPAPPITAADVLAPPPAARPARAPSRLRTARRGAARWNLALAAAAALVVVGIATWQTRSLQTQPNDGWKNVTPDPLTRVELQFAVERALVDGTHVEPGREGVTLGATDHLALRADVRGAGGWLYLFEVGDARPTLLWSTEAGPGVHAVQRPDGEPLVWQPDVLRGPTTYLAIVSRTDAVDPTELAVDVLAHRQRRDLWPQPVLAADTFGVTWESDPADR